MKVAGTSVLQAPPQEVWRALNDPAVLVQAIPGCQRLEALGEDGYKMTVAAGVGAIKGVYDGEVHLSEHREPFSFRMRAHGAGAPGTIGAEVLVMLAELPDGGTSLTYDADAVVGGTIGGVGQRMLTGVSRKMAEEFFGNVQTLLTGPPPAAATPAVGTVDAAAATAAAAGAAERPSPGAGAVFTPPPKPPAPAGQPSFVIGAVVGVASALAGVVVGAWVAGRRRS